MTILDPLTLTNQQARRFLLAHQGLWPPYQLAGKAGVLAQIRRLGCIQFDPLNIVGRNPDLVLQARVNGYRPGMLEELLYQDRRLLDGYDKMMAIYRVEDWPYFRRRREAARRRYGDSAQPATEIVPQVRQEIEARGPLSSIDLDFDQTVDWHWSPTRLARVALESMYWWGELIVHHKVNTRKVYDFAHRHLPAALLGAAEPNPDEEQFHDWYVLRRMGGMGLASARASDAWLAMGEIKARQRRASLGRLLERGQVLEVRVDGLDQPVYTRAEDRPDAEGVLDAGDPPPQAAILAPLDNLLWDRRLVKELFDFTYVWEVYKPVAQRLYGYYVLPILYGDRFVARFEPGRDKTEGVLTIQNWWWEPGAQSTGGASRSEGSLPPAAMRQEIKRCFEQFLGFLGREELRIEERAVEGAGLDWLLE